MIDVSVIVPVYNGEKFISKCLNSLVAQSLEKIEIIIIDDGSKDSTWNILCGYKKIYSNLIVTYKNKKNLGLGSTRNVGLSYAKGKYVAFVDADDWVERDYCKKLYDKAIQENADIVYCGFIIEEKNGEMQEKFYPQNMSKIFNKKYDYREVFLNNIHGTISYWSQLGKRELYINKGFKCLDNINYDEDYVLLCMPFLCHKIAVVNECLYHWIRNEESMSRCVKNHVDDRIKCANAVISVAKSLKIYDEYQMEWEYYYIVNVFLNSIMELQNIENDTHKSYCELKKVNDIVKKLFPNFLKNKYLLCSVFEKAVAIAQIVYKGEREFYKEIFKRDAELNIRYTKDIVGMFEKFSDKKIAIWGAGNKGKAFINANHKGVNSKISCIIDKKASLAGKNICNIPIVMPEICYDKEKIDIIIVMNHRYVKSVKEEMCDTVIEIIDFEGTLLFMEEE